MEAKLDELLREFRKGHREGSVTSAQTVDSLSTADKELWRSIRKELEEMGLSVAAFDANKDFIFSWLMRAIAEGAFEEEAEEMDEVGLGSDSGLSGSASTTRPASPEKGASEDWLVDLKLTSSPVDNSRSVHFPEWLRWKGDPQVKIKVEQIYELSGNYSQIPSPQPFQTEQRNSSASSTFVDDGAEPSPSPSPGRLEVTEAPSETQQVHNPSQIPKSPSNKLLSSVTSRNRDQNLLDLVIQGDPDEALYLLRSQSSQQSWASYTIYCALSLAVRKGFKELRKPLLVAGQVGINDHDLLREAIEYGCGSKTLQQLLSLGADPSLFRGSCILRAIEVHDENALRALLETGVDINARMGWGEDIIPLHRAMCLHTSTTIIRMMIDSGADVNRTDSTTKTPLGLAIAQRLPDCADILISHGADLEKPTSFSGISEPVAPLMGAVAMNVLSIPRLLVRKGADINKHYASPSVLDIFSVFLDSLAEYPTLLGKLDRAPASAVHASVVHDPFATGTLRMLLQEGAYTNWDIALILAFLSYRYRNLSGGPKLESNRGSLVLVLEKCSEIRGGSKEFCFVDLQVHDTMVDCIDRLAYMAIDDDDYLRLFGDLVVSRCG